MPFDARPIQICPSALMKKKAPSFAPPGIIDSFKTIWRDIGQEHAAFIVTCLYLLFEYNRPQSLYPVLDIIPWGKILLITGMLLSFGEGKASRSTPGAWLPLSLFSGCVLVSMITAFYPPIAFKAWERFFPWVFVVILITRVVTTRQRLFLFIAVYFLSNLKMAQHGFIAWAMHGFGFSSWGVTGSPGWFQNSGEFSMEMVMFLPLLLMYIVFFRKDWSRSVRLFFYLFSVMVIGSIVASSSRGAVIGLCIVGLWGLWSSRQRMKTIILLALTTTLIYTVMPNRFKERFETAGEDKTSLTRLAYWEGGMEAIMAFPAFGIGLANWPAWAKVNCPELIGAKGWGEDVEVLHNTYMEAATELGLAGGSAFTILLLQVYFTNRQSLRLARARQNHFLEATAIGLNGSLIAFMAPSCFMSVLYYPYVWILLAMTLCLSAICRYP